MKNNITKPRNLKDECRRHMAKQGFMLSEQIIIDGQYHELRTTKGKAFSYMALGGLINEEQSLICRYWDKETPIEYVYESHPLNEGDQKKLSKIFDELGLNEVEGDLKNLANDLLKKDDAGIDFSIEGLPELLRDYIKSICETTKAHPLMVTMSVLTTIAALVGKRVCYPYYFQKLYPNLWMLSIAKSGQFKTTALNKGAALAWQRHSKVMAGIKELEVRIRTTVDGEQKSKLEEERLSLSLTDVVLPTKITGEGLLEHLSQGHRGVILASEFGAFLQNLAKNHNNDLKSLFTDLYDVPLAYRYKTRNQGDLILEEPCFSICAVSTLTWVQENIKLSDVASGFFARFLIFTPTHKNEIPPALPPEDNNFGKHLKEEEGLLFVLEQVDDPHTYNPLSGDAKALFEGIHNKIYSTLHSYSDRSQEILEPYLKRWSPYLLKLSMLMQIIEDPQSKEISARAVIAALGILVPAMKSTISLFEGELGESDHQRKCRIVFEWICRRVKDTGKPVARQSLLCSRKLDGGVVEYDYILETLMGQGKLSQETKEKKNDIIYWPNNPPEDMVENA